MWMPSPGTDNVVVYLPCFCDIFHPYFVGCISIEGFCSFCSCNQMEYCIIPVTYSELVPVFFVKNLVINLFSTKTFAISKTSVVNNHFFVCWKIGYHIFNRFFFSFLQLKDCFLKKIQPFASSTQGAWIYSHAQNFCSCFCYKEHLVSYAFQFVCKHFLCCSFSCTRSTRKNNLFCFVHNGFLLSSFFYMKKEKQNVNF